MPASRRVSLFIPSACDDAALWRVEVRRDADGVVRAALARADAAAAQPGECVAVPVGSWFSLDVALGGEDELSHHFFVTAMGDADRGSVAEAAAA